MEQKKRIEYIDFAKGFAIISIVIFHYCQPYTSGFLAKAIGRELMKFVPGLGTVVAASWAGAYTWALGEGACSYFGDIVGGKKPDPEKIQKVMQNAFANAKQRFKEQKKL